MGHRPRVRVIALCVSALLPAGGALAQSNPSLQSFCDAVGAYMQEISSQRASGLPLEAAIDEVSITFDALATSADDLATRRRVLQWDRPLAVFAFALGDLQPTTVSQLGADHCVARGGDVRLAPARDATAAMSARAKERESRADAASARTAAVTPPANDRKRRRGDAVIEAPVASTTPTTVAPDRDLERRAEDDAASAAAKERAVAEQLAAEQRAAEQLAAEQRAAAERRAAELRAAEERKSAEQQQVAEMRKLAAERRAAEQQAAAERKAAEQEATAQRRSVEQQAAAERRTAEQQAAAERKAAEQQAAEDRRVAAQRVAEERKLAEAQRAAEERKAAEQRVAARESSSAEPTTRDTNDVPETAVAQRAPERESMLQPFYEFALATGGDTVGSIVFANGDEQDVETGNGLTFAGGLIQRINDQFGIKYTAGYKISFSAASNADVTKSVLPIDVVPYYRLGDHKIGAGLSLHLSPKVDWDWLGPTTNFDDAFGLTLEYAWRRFGFSYTNMDYETDDLSLDASHLSFKYSSRF